MQQPEHIPPGPPPARPPANLSFTWEEQRLHVLHATGLLDSRPSEGFDRITRMARHMFGVPIAAITLIDSDRQWFKSLAGLETRQTTREVAFCDHTIRSAEVMVVEDTQQDPRFAANPLVTGEPGIRFYAGAPLVMQSGHTLGALCLVDHVPRSFGTAQQEQLQDLAAMVMAQVDLHQSAGRVDGVTRLPNRAQLCDDLVALGARSAGGLRTMVLADIIGHEELQTAVRAVGIGPLEAVLRDVAARLRGHLGGASPLYHVAETRFVFLLPGGDRPAQEHVVTNLLTQMREPFTSGGVLVELQMQAGLVAFTLDGEGAPDALRQATSALYCASTAQQEIAWYTPDTDLRDRRAYAMLRDIPAALAQGEFRLVYQPKLDLRTLRYAGVEALIRWQHPRHGNIPPVDFIPLAENTPLIHLITEWALHTALFQLAQWKQQGLALAVAVNVSARNLEHPGFLRMLRNACALHDIEPGLLHIECTENAALTGRATLAVLHEVQAMGIQVSLDDFGTGYCNLACLHSLPAKLLKLDQSLVRPIADDPRAWALLQSVIKLGQSLGYRLLAEGVETAEIFDLLVNAGCDAAQGYYLSRPLEVPAVVPFVNGYDAFYAPTAQRVAC